MVNIKFTLMKFLKNCARALTLTAAVLSIARATTGPLPTDSPAAQKIAAEMRVFTDRGDTAGLVLLVADGERVLAVAPVGWASLEEKIPLRADAMFWIASMTKPVTTVALLMLVDEGKISLDDPVAKYLPEFNAPQKIVPAEAEKLAVTNRTEAGVSGASVAPAPASVSVRQQPITIRHLLSNTSGLRFGASEPTIDAWSLAEFAARAAQSDLLFEPGADYSYSTLNFTVAGRVIEVVAGEPYEIFLQRRVLDPLGMSDTTFWPNQAQIARLAGAYAGDPQTRTLTAKTPSRTRRPLDDRQRHPAPGGGLFATAADVAKFGQFLLNGGVARGQRLLSEKSFVEMTKRQTPPTVRTSYGLGLSVSGDSFGHGGALGTNFSVWPKEQLVLVFMVQKLAGWGGPDGDQIQPRFNALARELFAPKKIPLP
ncbi:MAG: beta-lactamase family protein [Verrucomicrobiales bacterium]|jgi:CubicO group peptidase (beta-lactamase class C family)|nr:beta-lactamase family protein [Verrucomicrobiales bacterium]